MNPKPEKGIFSETLSSQEIIEQLQLKQGKQLVVRKKSLQTGVSSGVSAGEQFSGTLAVDVAIGEGVAIKLDSGGKMFNTTAVQSVTEENGRYLIHTQTSTYEILLPTKRDINAEIKKKLQDITDVYQVKYTNLIELGINEKGNEIVKSFDIEGIKSLIAEVLDFAGLTIQSINQKGSSWKVVLTLADGYEIDFGSIMTSSMGTGLEYWQKTDSMSGLVAQIMNHYREKDILKYNLNLEKYK